MNHKMKSLFCLFLVSVLAFTGCGASKGADSSSAGVSSSSAAASSASSGMTASSSSSKASSASSVSSASPASNPSDSTLTSTVVTESNKAEGVNVAPGTSVALADGALEGTLGTKLPVPAKNPSFQLSVDKIELTDKRNAAAASADKVVRITYTYENTNLETLLIGLTSFKLLNSDGEACEIYYFDTTDDVEASAQPAAKGYTVTAAIGFILTGSSSGDVTLIYDDQQMQSGTEYYWKASV
jgi:hypothetical protein